MSDPMDGRLHSDPPVVTAPGGPTFYRLETQASRVERVLRIAALVLGIVLMLCVLVLGLRGYLAWLEVQQALGELGSVDPVEMPYNEGVPD